MMRFKAHNIKR